MRMVSAAGIGVAAAIAVAAFARIAGLDRDRAFYPTVLIVVASYYILFGVMGGDMRALAMDMVGVMAFVAMALIGFRGNQWVLVIGLAAHGVFDAFHGRMIANPGVPAWWPAWCASYDLTAAVCLAYLGARRGMPYSVPHHAREGTTSLATADSRRRGGAAGVRRERGGGAEMDAAAVGEFSLHR